MEETKLGEDKIRNQLELEERMKAVCPLCWEHNDDSTRYMPGELFNHLKGETHTKEDLADFLQEDQLVNQTYGPS